MATTTERKRWSLRTREKHPHHKGEFPPLWTRTWVWVTAVVAILVIWLLPAIAGHTGLVGWIANRSAADLNGRVIVQSASLGWFSPVKLYGVEIVDREEHPVIEVPQVQGDRAMMALLWNAANLGRFRLEAPKLTVVLRDNGSNVEEVFANYLASKEKKQIDVGLQIVDGSVSIEEARTQRTVQIDKFELDFSLPANRARPLELKTSGLVAGSEQGGQFEVAVRLQQEGASDQPAAAPSSETQDKEAEASGPDTISLKADKVSLAVLEPLVRRAAPGTRLAGRLTGAVECRWNSRRPEARAALRGNITVEELKVSGRMFGKDQPALGRFHAEGLMAWQNGVVEFDRVTTESDVGTLSLAGTLDLAGRAAGAARSQYEVKGHLDLARLAAILPSTLRIQKDTQITSGRVQLALSSRPGQEGMVWKGRLETSNLTANSGGRQLVWQQPVLVTLAARQTAQGPVVENLKCESSFLKVQASGAVGQLTGSATFDVGKLADQSRGFVDLGGLRVSGDGSAQANWKRTGQGNFDAGVQLRINGFQWTLPGQPAWTEDALVMSVSATGQIGDGAAGRSRLDTAVARFESGSDLVEARLLAPVADFALGQPLPLEIHSQGQLARWPGRLGPWLSLKGWSAGGSYDLLTEAVFSTSAIQSRQARFTSSNLELKGPSFVIREPKAEATLVGRWDRVARRVELENASLSTSTLSVAADRFLAALPQNGQPELSGTLVCQAALDRLQASTIADPKAPPAWRMAGRLAGKAEFQQSAGLISGKVDGQVNDLDIVHRSGQRYQDREVRFSGQLSYNDVSRLVHVERAEFTSATARSTVSGKIANITSQPDLQLTGQIDYDLERLSQAIRAMVGDGVRLGGKGSSPVSYRGVWGSDKAVAAGAMSWDWAQLYSFEIGRGALQASLSNGMFDVQPLAMDCNGGKLRVTPHVKLTQQAKELSLDPGRVVDQVRITPKMCADLLQYMAPLLAGVARAEGQFSIDLEGLRLPFNLAGTTSPASSSPFNWYDAEIAGKLVIHSAQIGPGFLIQELAQLLGKTNPAYLMRESVIPFRVTKGRIYHQQMELTFNEVTVRTYGSVGLVDQTVALMVEMPIPPKWQNSKLVGTALKNQTIKLPITGYLRQMKIDRTALDQLTRQFFQTATQNALESRLNKPLEKLLGPLPKR